MASKRKQNVFILEVNSLDLSEVEIGFGLKKVNDINWAQFRTPFEIADCCQHTLNMLDDFRIQMPPRLGILLLDVHTKPPNPNSPGSPPIPISSKFEFSFQPFSRHGTRDTSLSGVPSYLLWYGPDVGEDLAVNSIIVEKKEGQSAAGVPQCLAYMGMFHFLLISSEGKWSQLDLNYSSHRQEIVETLAYFHTQASVLSTFCGSGTSENGSQSRVASDIQKSLHVQRTGTSVEDWSIFQVTNEIEDAQGEDDDDEI
ncbi:hypothetical protein PEX2_101130 [Penicillium expansum]|uniref:Uncharacterized protein n=1 Tax=Penicillium expansum TaxID=27334 RepID=A0A0A2K1S5_PENEN|nr:hypothetical protein PEX2_101130 [Penicillium expansum]KGO60848.1 hypothetical protein PEX2_101130 [Penicillium expansum]